MNHNNGVAKLNLRGPHRRALLRNQMISFIKNGKLISTKARVKEVQRSVEKLVTIAKRKDLAEFNVIRKISSALPFDSEAVYRLIREISLRYVDRPGGYTRCLGLGRRVSDTASIAMLTWV